MNVLSASVKLFLPWLRFANLVPGRMCVSALSLEYVSGVHAERGP